MGKQPRKKIKTDIPEETAIEGVRKVLYKGEYTMQRKSPYKGPRRSESGMLEE